jgi:protein SCO1/2
MFFWVLIGGVATNGYANFVLESERRDMLFSEQPNLTFMRMIDDDGQLINLSQYAIQQNKVLIAEFIYTKCKTLCITLGNLFQQTQFQIIENNLQSQLGLVSISFDVANENQASLQSYRKRMRAKSDVWTIFKMSDQTVLESAKRKLGLMVIENDQKDFVHNSAFIVISRTGDLIGIYAIDDISSAIEQSINLTLHGEKSEF